MKLSKKVWIPLSVLAGLMIAFVIIFPSLYFTVFKVNLQISAVQIDDSQKIHVEWDTSKPVNKVTVEIRHNGKLVREYVTKTFSQEMDVDGFYGRMEVKVTVKKGVYTTSKTKKVNLSADEYNIAPLTATMPVTLFSLSLADVTNNGEIPTFVWFKRSGAWDWQNLPENVYAVPVATGSEFLKSKEEKMYRKTSEWIKELYEINPDSKFHLFYNDYFAYGWVQATIANGIPTENYDVKLISDGTASFSYFNQHFDFAPEIPENADTAQTTAAYQAAKDKADAEYAKMVENWNTLKTQVAKKGEYDKKTKAAISADKLREYAFVMANEENNVEWWLTRKSGTLATKGVSGSEPSFYTDNVDKNDKVVVKDLKTLMQAIPGYGAEPEDETWKDKYMNVEKIKKLYHFSDNMFEKATKENKKIMVILGTWNTTAPNEPNLEQYTKALRAYYGDDYVYYYKGHPKFPTNSIHGKLEELESYGLIDVDSTIAAELIYFFNPEAYFCGYASTTFETVDAEHSCGVFGAREASFEQPYKNKIDFVMSMAAGSGIQIEGVQFDLNTVLFEFNETADGVDELPYDIALFNKGEMKYYKLTNGAYVEVK